jgi:hypothetical protein
MKRTGVGWRRAGLLVALLVLLGACARHGFGSHAESDDSGINAYPANYKTDILGAMHAYLNDPTGIRDAAVSQPMLKTIEGRTRYVACLRYNARQDDGSYAGIKQSAAVYLAGKFDHFAEAAAALEPCAQADYAPFPELEKLSR